jgi:mannosylglycoprotein endo-beta-mannosidase
VTHLQYANDTLILIQYDAEELVILKFLLMCFEEMSGLKINVLKSEVLVLGQPAEIQTRVADILNCKLGTFPFTYLGMPISNRKLTIEQWMFLVLKIGGRIETWLGGFLSSGG